MYFFWLESIEIESEDLVVSSFLSLLLFSLLLLLSIRQFFSIGKSPHTSPTIHKASVCLEYNSLTVLLLFPSSNEVKEGRRWNNPFGIA